MTTTSRPGKTLAAMTLEIREVNIAKGHRPAEGGPGANTFGDYIALLVSEIGEAVDAYRDWKLDDATDTDGDRLISVGEVRPPKPRGVPSEFADMVIRFIDMCDVFGVQPFDMDLELDDVADLPVATVFTVNTFGDHLAWITFYVSRLWLTPATDAPMVLRAMVTTARRFGIDLNAEYERKLAYNRTRPFRHGGRTLTDTHA